ncbi:hypothetical protein B0J18DRAFT_468958 [Chaetomium sp. MPI-SDFR-AT-0129]|nr:hypothetical protein B0J18DRAFT_468958 [Chaetomium sp. MPI-SDFR-AT-0129]
MKFTLATVLALATVAFAYPTVQENVPVKRQANIAGNVVAQTPAMSDQAGNVIPFDSTKVYQDAKVKGQ